MDQGPTQQQGAGTGAGLGYPGMQLARALSRAEQCTDPQERARAQEKVDQWSAALFGILGGGIRPGSRTPVSGLPAWATLQVVTGGFATGDVLSGGPLQPHEQALLQTLGLQRLRGDAGRHALNTWFLTEEGQQQLGQWLQSGCYEINVPEEGALLAVQGLTRCGQAEAARSVLDVLIPFFGRMRFFPKPADVPVDLGSKVCLEPAGRTAQRLDAKRVNRQVQAQQESVTVWTPFYDELVALFLETVDGEPPLAQRTESGDWRRNERATIELSGGWPGTRHPEGWTERAEALLHRFQCLRESHRLCTRPDRTDDSLGLLLAMLRRRLQTPAEFGTKEAGRVRLVLGRYLAKHGHPASERCRWQRERERQHAGAPLHRDIGQVVAQRLRQLPADQGVDRIDPLLLPVADGEDLASKVPGGTAVPPAIARKVERCLRDTMAELVRRGLIGSGEVLAALAPHTSAVQGADGIADPALRALYVSIYRAFRQRRSLLLLNLERQVQLAELPWVAALGRMRGQGGDERRASRTALEELVVLALKAYPHAVLPNKLIREIDALATSAGLDLPLTEELAADIFMGEFSPKYAAAAHLAWQLIGGTLYARYYGIADDPSQAAEGFAAVCFARAGPRNPGGRGVAYNGCVIEQQQILTTHNLAILIGGLGLRDRLAPEFESLAKRCFDWGCRRLQVRTSDWHTRLIHIKHAAYAWRQMVFFLAMCSEDQAAGFEAWARERLQRVPVGLRERIDEALSGLGPCEPDRTRVFLGWTVGPHWMA
jgi:hypothetical protein